MSYLELFEEAELAFESYRLDKDARGVVLSAIRKCCCRRKWRLLAAHVRPAHVHAVVEADASPEMVMAAFKASASFALNRFSPEERGRKRWSRHGSTRYLWEPEAVEDALIYVLYQQDEPMAVYCEGPIRQPNVRHV